MVRLPNFRRVTSPLPGRPRREPTRAERQLVAITGIAALCAMLLSGSSARGYAQELAATLLLSLALGLLGILRERRTRQPAPPETIQPPLADRPRPRILTDIVEPAPPLDRVAGGEPPEPLMRRAEIALAAARRAGGGILRFDSAQGRAQLQLEQLGNELRAALAAGQILPCYEPQVGLASGALHGFAVTASWDHPLRGPVDPKSLLAIAERADMIADLSLAVIRQALEDAGAWDSSLTLTVPIGPTMLQDPWLAEKIVKLLVETGFPAPRLRISITEAALFDDPILVRSIAGSLRNQGVGLVLDGFGTGISSANHLALLPLDRFVLDERYVAQLAADPASAATVEAVLRMAATLSIPVTAIGIAEGVVAARLRTLGCHEGQGRHYGAPMAVGQVHRLLAERSLLATGRDVA